MINLYGYVIEKQIGSDMLADLGHITSLVENVNNVHHLLSSLFGVKDEEGWRSKYNILYYVEFKSGYRLYIKSDKEIDEKAVAANNFKILSKFDYDFSNGDIVNISLLVAPFRKKDGESKRTYIDGQNERMNWLKYKLERKEGICEILDIKEGDAYKTYMCHDVKAKGETTLVGLNYDMRVKVKNAAALKETMCAGIGSEKNYGFGLVRVC